MNHVVIASYHGVGRSLDLFVQERITSFKWFVYLQCDDHTFSESRKKLSPYSNLTHTRMHTSRFLSFVISSQCWTKAVYLHHIIMMYHNLPPLLFFLQENEMPGLTLASEPRPNRYVFYRTSQSRLRRWKFVRTKLLLGGTFGTCHKPHNASCAQ